MRKLRITAFALLVLILVVFVAAYLLLRSSLPDIDARQSAAGLAAPIAIERDNLGVATIRGSTRADVAWATGYAHGQDRFFQMDLLRRVAAGELSEVFGAVALDTDKRRRVHQLRKVARAVLQRASEEDRALVTRYAGGVNAGLGSLRGRPFEYWLLRGQPAAWQPEDTVLVVFAMYIDLSENFNAEDQRGTMRAVLPAELEKFLYSVGSEWDAPLIGAPLEMPPIPGPDVYDLRKAAPALPVQARTGRSRSSAGPRSSVDLLAADDIPAGLMGTDVGREEHALGSNSWAVGGLHTATGAGLLASDMHLGLNVPTIWYRARLLVESSGADALDITGVTLPGAPLLIAGSNGSIAWGFTNSYGDWCDLVLLDMEEGSQDRYLTPEGPSAFERATETIHVHGAPDETLEVRRTIWGPVIGADVQGRLRAAVWTAHYPEATNVTMRELEQAKDVATALDIGARSGIPPQNFVVADAAGNIGWTIMGRIPVRVGYDEVAPASWNAPGVGWQGWLAPSSYPRLVNPPQGRIWTANQRTADGPALELLGDGGYAFGARAGQIREALLAKDIVAEGDMLAIQLDDRSRIHERWRAKLVSVLDEAATDGQAGRTEARRLVESWHGRAATNSAGFRILRGWRDRIRERVFTALTAEVRARYPAFALSQQQRFEAPLWRLVQEEPVHLLDPAFASWREFELAMLDELVAELQKECGTLAACTWGKRNRIVVRHPLSRAVSPLAALLDMPLVELPGDVYTPRVQGRDFGASERFGVSPGHEVQAYYHMPGGQSGHPLSPFYRAGFDAWAEGRPLPFLPGKTQHTLTFEPAP